MEAFRNARPILGHLLTTLQASNGSAQLLTDDDLRTEREPVKEPARAWRNWWRVYREHWGHCAICDVRILVQPGLVRAHCKIWPSKDLAESNVGVGPADVDGGREYLGAYPEGERP